MSEIRLLKQAFNICDIKNVPPFLAPYTFVMSMPNKLSIICPTSEIPSNTLSVESTCSCMVLDAEDQSKIMKSTSALVEILTNAHIKSNVILMQNSSYIFVDTDDAMNAVMLLTKFGYDIRYSEFY